MTTFEPALQRAGRRAGDVDQVALIGGSALVPMFQRVVAGVFPARGVTLAPRADVAVAIGTVLLTARFGAERRASRCSTSPADWPRRLAQRLGHDAPGAGVVGGGERAFALLAAAAVADQERLEFGAHGLVVDLATLRPPAIRPRPAWLWAGTT